MTASELEPTARAHRCMVDVEIVVPVFNEEIDLEPSVRRLNAYLTRTSRSGP